MGKTCDECDYGTVMGDGSLVCAVRDKHVHGSQTCDFWQVETREVDGDQWYERMTWPTKSKSHRS